MSWRIEVPNCLFVTDEKLIDTNREKKFGVIQSFSFYFIFCKNPFQCLMLDYNSVKKLIIDDMYKIIYKIIKIYYFKFYAEHTNFAFVLSIIRGLWLSRICLVSHATKLPSLWLPKGVREVLNLVRKKRSTSELCPLVHRYTRSKPTDLYF